MPETTRGRKGSGAKVQEFLRDSLEVAQARVGALEEEAQKILKDLSTRVGKVSKKDWKELRNRAEKLRKLGLEAAGEWRDRAETIRADAVDRLVELQARAVKFLGVATHDEVAELSREINKILRRLDDVQKRRARRPAQRKPAAVEAQA